MLKRQTQSLIDTTISISKFCKFTFFKILESKPRIWEVINNNLFKIGVLTVFSPFLEWLIKNGNPTTDSILRDLLSFFGIESNIKKKQEISQTQLFNDLGEPMFDSEGKPMKEFFRYDEYSRVGTRVRAGCKFVALQGADQLIYMTNSTISAINYYNLLDNTLHSLNKDKYATSARFANIACEPASLLLNVIIPKERQSLGKTDIHWFTYIFTGAKITWIYKALIGTVVRAYIPDQVGEFWRWTKSLDIAKKPYYAIDGLKNQALAYIFTIEQPNSNDALWTQISKINYQIYGNIAIESENIDQRNCITPYECILEASEIYIVSPMESFFSWVTEDLNRGRPLETAFTVTKALTADATILVCGYGYRIAMEIAQAYVIMTPTRAAYRWVDEDIITRKSPLQTAITVSKAIGLYISLYHLVNAIPLVAKSSIDYLYPESNDVIDDLTIVGNDEL